MIKRIKLVYFLVFAVAVQLSAQQLEREEVPDKYKWDLTHLYPSIEAWRAEQNIIEDAIPKLESYQGKLGESAETLKSALDTYFGTLKTFYRFSGYASRLSDQDLRVTENQALTQEVSSLGTQIGEATSYMEPEILQIDPDKLNSFYKEAPGLKIYKNYLDDIQRRREHTLSPGEEKILASFGLVTGTPSTVYNIFDNTELPYAEVTLTTGEEVTLSAPMYVKYRSTEVREDRAEIFEKYFENFGRFKNTLAANYGGKLKADFVYSKARKYDSALEYSLDGNNIPVSVYENLIEQINNSLPTLHRYLDLKEKMLGVEELHYYDLYTPLVEKVEMDFEIEEGQDVILTALEPLGEEYTTTVKKAYTDRWIDYYPTTGKRSGAYSTGGAYDVHPYILTNWTDDYDAVSTLAHELGHTMHSYFSNKHQPFVDAGYSIFVAEIASTLNENLLNDYMVNKVDSDEKKLYLLGSYLDMLRTTIFRQTLFAEFEWEAHKMIESGKPVNGDNLSELYLELVKKYYGHDAGHCYVDDYIKYEWLYIPHFVNYTYYVYQYSTSLIYSTAIAEKIIRGEENSVDNYFKILKGGASKYPIDLIKDSGIDPLSSEPFELTMARMNRVMDQIDELIEG